MKEFKGTKGEWYVDHEESGYNEHRQLCTPISTSNNGSYIIGICDVYGEDKESISNAKLIASAPELLEALQHGLRLAESLKNKESIAVRMFIKSAQQAINKALGYD